MTLNLIKQFSSIARFAGQQCGNVTIIFALTLTVVVGVSGVAIDYIRLIQQRTAFNAAADAAVLAALSSAQQAEKNGEPGIAKLAKNAAEQAWLANVAGMKLKFQNPPNIDVNKSGMSWTATVSFDEKVSTSFMSVVGITAMPLNGEARASTTIEKVISYYDVHVVIDTSSSMGIGATKADMDAMQANPDINCTFACHWLDNTGSSKDTVWKAANAGYKLRVDIVDEAVDSMVDDMKIFATADNVRAKLWGMNDTVGSLVDLTTKLNDIKNHKIELYKTPVSVGNTNYEASFAKLETEVGKAGQGKSSTDPKKAVFIVTDGIHDTASYTSNVSYVWYDKHQMGPVDPAFCQTMKDNGVLVGVLYIDYIAPPQFADVMANVTPSVLPKLEACATEGMFFNATSPDGISQAMKDMLAAAFGGGKVRLTE